MKALEALLDGEPGIALSAYQTLETLATDDSRQVSSAAAQALAVVHVGVAPELIDFGTVILNRGVEPRVVELTGSLAAACQLVVHDAPIRLSRRGGRIEVALDVSQPAAFDGSIEVIGPSGGAAVAIQGEVRAPRSGIPWRRGDLHERAVPPADVHGPEVDANAPPSSPPFASPDRSARWLGLCWVVVVFAGVAGFVHGDSDASWYDRLTDWPAGGWRPSPDCPPRWPCSVCRSRGERRAGWSGASPSPRVASCR